MHRRRILPHITLATWALGVLTSAASSHASERHFTYSYESNVLNPGSIELEPWTTYRAGRERFYSRFDQRLELELGIVPNLQASLYWNQSAIAADVEDPTGVVVREKEYEFEGVSNEWKYKLSDSFADALGSALYFEWTLAPAEAELEAKVILDKRVGDFLFAYNLTGEHEWKFEQKGETEREIEITNTAGLAYFVTPNFTAGLELRGASEIEHGELESTAIFVGPTLAYSERRWWTALTFQPQIAALKEEEGDADDASNLDLENHERIEVRWLVGVEL